MRVCPCYTAFSTLNGIPIPGLGPTFMLYARRHACFRRGSLRHTEMIGNLVVESAQTGAPSGRRPSDEVGDIEKNGFSEMYSPKVSLSYFFAFLLVVPSPP